MSTYLAQHHGTYFHFQQNQVNDFEDGYNQHLDSHLGVWVSDLKSTMEQLEKDKAPHYAMTWTEGRDSYYSVMTVPCGGFYIEFLSEKATGIANSKFHTFSTPFSADLAKFWGIFSSANFKYPKFASADFKYPQIYG